MATEYKYDVFISYRRESGTYQAQALRADLENKYCSVFMDTRKMGSGDFTKKLDKKIREYSNFVVVISKDCFPHKNKNKDYFLYEIGLALRLGKNVIPIYYDGIGYEDIEKYLYGIENFQNQNAITYHNDDPEGSVNQIVSFLKTKEEVLKERYESLSTERALVRQELMVVEKSNSDSKCPVCDTSHSATMIYCNTCGYKFFDELEKSVASSNEKIQERERLEKHKEIWHSCQSGENDTKVKKELDEARTLLKISESRRLELEKELEFLDESLKETNKSFSTGKESLEFRLNDKVSFKMIHVEGGKFMMGSSDDSPEAYPDERPLHLVELSSFYIGETVVTQGLWKAVMGNNPSYFKGDDLPVDRVAYNHDDKNISIIEFVNKLNDELHKNRLLPQRSEFRLPTEAEWEYAARGGKKGGGGFTYSGSDNIDEVAWWVENSKGKSHPVKRRQPNDLGLFDMSGNVWEWCQDWYISGCYKELAPAGLSETNSASRRVLRGGDWRSNSRECRVACRNYCIPTRRGSGIGFRLVLSPTDHTNALSKS